MQKCLKIPPKSPVRQMSNKLNYSRFSGYSKSIEKQHKIFSWEENTKKGAETVRIVMDFYKLYSKLL